MSERYARHLSMWTDIRRHLPYLKERARGNVLELGVRDGISTSALLAGVEEHGGHVWSVDITEECGELYDHPQWTFIQANSRDAGAVISACALQRRFLPTLDLLFLDTLHHYEHVKAELDAWGDAVRPGGCILVHDTDLSPGAGRAVSEWAAERRLPAQFRSGSMGLGIINIPKERD